METTANDVGRATRGDGKAVKHAANDPARRGRSAANHELNNLIADVEDLMSRVHDAADPEIARLRAKVEGTLASAKQSLADGAESVQRHAKDALAASDQYVREQPWQAIGAAALAGLAIGFLVSRR
jgi:ElaB/YqjD/DUF883 family membrane-anchored ribosome-binding protein